MIENYDLKTAIFTLSLLALSATLATCPLLLLNVPGEVKKKKNFESESTSFFRRQKQQLVSDLKVLKLFSFWQVTLIYVVFIYVFVIFLIILPDFSVSRGIVKHNSALLVSIYSIGDLLGRLLPGLFHFKNLVYNQTFYLYSMIAMSCLFFLIGL